MTGFGHGKIHVSGGGIGPRGQRQDLGGENTIAIVDLDARRAAPVVANSHARRQGGAGQGPIGQVHVQQFQVLGNFLAAHADGMDGHTEVGDLGKTIRQPGQRIVRPVADQDDRRQRRGARLAQHLQ